MEYSFINKLTQFGKTSYDVLITTDLGEYRQNYSFAEGEDTEEAKQAAAESLAERFDKETFDSITRQSILAKVAMGGEAMKNYIQSNASITLQDFADINTLTNSALEDLNIVLDTPNVQEILVLRIEDSINKIKQAFADMPIENDTESKVDTALATILGGIQ